VEAMHVQRSSSVCVAMLAGAILTLAGGCGGSDAERACTGVAVPSVAVEVQGLDGSSAQEPMVSVLDVSGRQACAPPTDSRPEFICYGNGGQTTVEVGQGDRSAQAEVLVPTTEDGCHPVTQSVVVVLGT